MTKRMDYDMVMVIKLVELDISNFSSMNKHTYLEKVQSLGSKGLLKCLHPRGLLH